MVVAVDDLTLSSSSASLLSTCKSDLQSKFKILDMGAILWLLGVEVKQNHCAQTLTLSQKAYIALGKGDYFPLGNTLGKSHKYIKYLVNLINFDIL